MNDNQALQLIQRGKNSLLFMGILMAITGLLAIIFPVVSSLAVNYFVGGLLTFVGIVQVLGSFSVKGTQSFFGGLLFGLLSLAAGVFIIFNPLAVLTVITVILAVLFVIEGVFHLVLAFEIKPNDSWGWVLFSGFISIFLGMIVISGISSFSLVLIGILLGINFLSTGIAILFMYHQIK